ncbi:MAG: DUF2892 domain-containing protein [Gemmatimonadetes bacterium]|nr:DUF2892 domain-containing protein [Gemmatimonadota bacterium]
MSTLFRKNMTTADRAIRAMAAVVLLALAVSDITGPLTALGCATIAIVLLVTSVSATCPLYSALGKRGTQEP